MPEKDGLLLGTVRKQIECNAGLTLFLFSSMQGRHVTVDWLASAVFHVHSS